MWLFTELGFYSIVKKGKHWHVRARIKADAERLSEKLDGKPEVLASYPGSDYPWRMIVTAKQKTEIFRLLSNVEYDNFKGHIGHDATQRGRLGAYHEVWHTMAALGEKARP
jgi:hypothetical protein